MSSEGPNEFPISNPESLEDSFSPEQFEIFRRIEDAVRVRTFRQDEEIELGMERWAEEGAVLFDHVFLVLWQERPGILEEFMSDPDGVVNEILVRMEM
ncbi:MAG: hypothetical protein AB200_00615 [Parcubacteria bacterium C7867-005]|nr:MAG: hypothetical protein AB200_00615 [Parcubacteria bacterium C7867-005]